jgi:hypothetical protein
MGTNSLSSTSICIKTHMGKAAQLAMAVMLPALPLAGGCTSISPQHGTQATLDDYRQGPLVLEGQVQHWDQQFIPDETPRTFEIIDGTDKGKTVEVTVSSSSNDRWTITLEHRSVFEWARTDAGIFSEQIIDIDSGTTSTFTPPLPIVPHDIHPGVPYTSSGTIMVTATAPPSSKVASGTWTVTIIHDADVMLRLGGTLYKCARLRTEYSADLGLATVVRTTYDYYAMNSGWVAQVFDQDVVKVIIPTKTNGTWVLK